MNNQGNTEQKEQKKKKKASMYHSTQLQNILQSHSNRNIMVLTQKQT
jgi:hypothetical protein